MTNSIELGIKTFHHPHKEYHRDDTALFTVLLTAQMNCSWLIYIYIYVSSEVHEIYISMI